MRNLNTNIREEYIKAWNEYGIIIEEERNFESDIVRKCKEAPKLSYRYVNGKMKSRNDINKLTDKEEFMKILRRVN